MPNFRLVRMWTLAAAICALAVAHAATAAVTWTKVLAGIAQPVEIAGARDGSGRLFVVQQTGVVRVVKNGALLATPFLDLGALTASSGERGLLGLAFHPQFATNRQFFVYYTRPSDNATVVARYTASATTPDVADPASATVLLVIAQPYDNHKGGALKFGADGYLYIGMGDGGSGNDPQGRAQDKTTLLGKILRIDVEQRQPVCDPGRQSVRDRRRRPAGDLRDRPAQSVAYLVRPRDGRLLDRRRRPGRGGGDRHAAGRHRRRREPGLARASKATSARD